MDDKYANADVLDSQAGEICVVFTADGSASNMVSKYRPPCPIVVVSESDEV